MKPRSGVKRPGKAANWAWRVVDAGLFVALPVTALFLGGRHDLGRLIYLSGVMLASLGWLSATLLEGARSRPSRVYAVILAAVTVVFLQLINLSPTWITELAPGLADRLVLWNGADHGSSSLGAWSTISAAPGETRLGLALLVGHAALFIVVLHRLKRMEDLRQLVNALAGLSVGMAVLGFVQWLAPNGRALWVYDHPYRPFMHMQGAFANQNHFAHFIALGIPACLLKAMECLRDLRSRRKSSRRGERKRVLKAVGWSGGAVLSVAAVLLTQSRGGLLALLVAFGACLVMMRRHHLIKTRLGPVMLAGLATTVIAAVWVGQSTLQDTLQLSNALVEGDFAEEGGRADIWRANRRAFAENPWLGWGAGTHRLVYPMFFDATSSTEFTHAESGYLQIATETGLAGLTLLIAAILIALSWGFQLMRRLEQRHAWVASAVMPPLLTSLVHSIGDFVWYLPACLGLTLAAAAGALRLVQLQSEQPSANPKQRRFMPAWAHPATVTIGAGLAALAYLGPGSAAGDWDRYLRLSRAVRDYNEAPLTDSALEREHRHKYLVSQTKLMLTALDDVIHANPCHIEARLRRSTRQRQLLDLTASDRENAMSTAQLNQAALQAGFTSLAATRSWLTRAYGDAATQVCESHHHAEQATNLCPLAGQAYLTLAELSCLSPPILRDRGALVLQSLAVRPNEGAVLFEAGFLMQQQGEQERAIELWRRSCKDPGSHRQALVSLFCSNGVPASQFIKEMQPNWPVLRLASRQYQELGSEDDLRVLAQYATKLGQESLQESPRIAIAAWALAGNLHFGLGNDEAAVEVLQRAHESAPSNFAIRSRLASALIRYGRHADAAQHLRWCLARRPDLIHLQKALANARRVTIREQAMRTDSSSVSTVKRAL